MVYQTIEDADDPGCAGIALLDLMTNKLVLVGDYQSNELDLSVRCPVLSYKSSLDTHLSEEEPGHGDSKTNSAHHDPTLPSCCDIHGLHMLPVGRSQY